MNTTQLLRSRGALVLAASLCALAVAPTSQAALLLRYDFEGIDTGTGNVPNVAPGASVNGTLINTGQTTTSTGNVILIGGTKYSLGTTLQFTSADGADAEAAGHVNTGLAASSLSLTPSTAYTAMAWVKWGSTTGDNMIFGQPASGDALHLGSRGGNYHSGHWGDDLGPDQGINIPTGTGAWHHVAYTNTTAGLQTIFVDGVQVAQGANGTGGSMSTGNNVLIGTSRNNGSLVGTLDEVRVFDSVLTATEIQTQMKDLPVYNLFELTKQVLGLNGYTFELTDSATSVVKTSTISLTIDGNFVTPTSVNKVGSKTTILYTPPTAETPGSTHNFVLFAADTAGSDVTSSGALRAPYFPATLPGPEGSVGVWGMREIRNGAAIGDPGLVNSVAIASAKPQLNDPPDPQITDGTAPVVNHSDPQSRGGRGNFNNDLDFIGNQPGDDDNVILVAKTKVTVPAAGAYTFSVHSDDGFGLRVDGGKFVSTGGGGSIDASDPRSLVFVNYTGDSNARGTYQFDAAGTYDVLLVAFEGGGGAFWEVAWAPGTYVDDRDTNLWTLVGNPNDPAVLAVPFSPKYQPANLPGPRGGDNTFGVRTYLNANSVDNLQQTFDFLASTDRTPANSPSNTVDSQLPRLNHIDPNTNGISGVIGCDEPFPGNVLTGSIDDDRVVTVAKGRIRILEESDYTFNAHGDDGFFLRIKGVGAPNPSFKRVTGLGRFEMSNPNEMFFDAGTGDTNTRGIIHLVPGDYDLEYVMWEGGGGFWYELSIAKGAFLNDADTNTWRPVGYMPPSGTTLERPGISSAGWTVETSAVEAPELIASFSIAGAEAALDASGTTSTWDVLNFNDPQSGGPGSIAGDVPFPRDTPADDNNYAIRATGTLVIPSEGDYLLGFQGDDGGYIQVVGQSWDAIIENATGASSISGDSIRCDVGTGNSRTVGRIHLAAGNYTIKTLMFEGGGGSYWEVFGLKGPAGFCMPLPLLAKDAAGTTVSDVAGMPLVAVPPPQITSITRDATTGDVTIVFTSSPGDTYSLEYTDGFKPSTVLQDSGEWFTFPLTITADAGTTTTFTGNPAALLQVNGGMLTQIKNVFIRIRRN